MMNDTEFVEFAFRRVLRREPEESARKEFVSALASGKLARTDFLMSLLESGELTELIHTAEPWPPGHFYSVIPSLKEREQHVTESEAMFSNHKVPESLPGIDLRREQQLELVEWMANYHAECPFPDQEDPAFRYYCDNPSYGWGDGLTLYGMMRHFKPRRVVEVGSGFSSQVILDTNEREFDGAIDCTFIEPHPELLRSRFRDADHRHTVFEKPVQDVDLEVFARLEANDILLIDSTHASKLRSDVNRELFEILPTLKPGVIVHIHDIFWPFEYPSTWIEQRVGWNEIYMVRAFLEFNSDFEIVFFNHYLYVMAQEAVSRCMPRFTKNCGGAIWLRRTR